MRKKFLRLPIIICIIFLVTTQNIFAHSGRTDANGGHNKTADGTYHYHKGEDRTIEYNSVKEIADEVTVLVNGEKIIFDQLPIIMNGRTMVPVRFVVEKLGCIVDWDGDNSIIYITSQGRNHTTKLNDTSSIMIAVNDEVIKFDNQTPIIINGRTLVPIKNVVEKLNCTVDWEQDTKTVIIKSK